MNMAGRDADKIQIGAIRYVDGIPEEKDVHYTVITVPNAKKGLTSEITGLVRKAVGADEVLSVKRRRIKTFEELVDLVRRSNRADLVLDGYHYMLWELGLLSPIGYIRGTPFDPTIRNIDGLNSIQIPDPPNFAVLVDGVQLWRPIWFPNPITIDYPSPDPCLYPLLYDAEVAGRRLRFTGYILAQQPRIQPEELKGIHIRIRDVGIGRYDKSWLGYPFDEGVKFSQVTGEVFVEDGLEQALNIDRDSFRETDVHFQAMRAYVWDVLRHQVFPSFKSRQKAFREARNTVAFAAASERFLTALRALPAALAFDVRFEDSPAQTLLATIKQSKAELKLERTAWELLVAECGMDKEAQNRLIRVLQALVSSELLNDVTEDDFGPLLRVLAIAVQ